MSTPTDQSTEALSVVAYVAALEAENASLKERVAAFESGSEGEISQRVAALDADRQKTFNASVEARAVALMSKVGQPAPLAADMSTGTADQPGQPTGLARATNWFRREK